MAREESIAESAKQRSLRVPLDHYVRPDRLRKGKWAVSIAAGAIALAYAAWILIAGQSGHGQVSPGPVAAAHATWNDDCQACHKDFQPLRGDAVSLVGLFGGQKANRESLDEGCIKCHHTADHHASAKLNEVPNCAACHRDHLGRMADIVRPSDANCLGCHRENDLHRNGPSKLAPPVVNVTGFGPTATNGQGPHPDFRSLQSDPGNIKFNHWLHLQPGIAVADAKKKLTLSDLDEEQRKRYAAYSKEDGLVQLDCAACHEPDSATNGKYMRPIAFEQHCQACHPLDARVSETLAIKVPHGLTAARLTTVLDGLLLAQEQPQTDVAPTTDESGKVPLIPGKTLGSNLAQKIGADLLGRRIGAGRAIMVKCLECHYAKNSADGSTHELSDVLEPNIPDVWLRHARFDHLGHRHVECRVCHAGAYAYTNRDTPQFINPPAKAIAARDDEQVMIAGLESCASCHAPARGTTGGARHDCAECHKYHGGDHALAMDQSVDVTYRPSGPLEHVLANSEPRSDDRGYYLSALRALGKENPSRGIHQASFIAQAVTTPQFVGASSCASAGCHGEAQSGVRDWQTSFTTWAFEDPHVQAYDVLWTFRGREMTRLLEGQPSLTEAEHFRTIERRCIGCHATPAPAGSPANNESYAIGVHCESCHGLASEWLHTHYQAGFRRDTPGFVDTKNLSQRPAACMKCHVGPSDAHGSPQAVDHDLIAAGHPRLAFEFLSYFASKPAHWNRKVDEARQPGSFHFRSWLSGQLHQTEQREKLAPQSEPVDFSQLDCAACHHALAADSWRRPAKVELMRTAASPSLQLLKSVDTELPLPARLRLVGQILSDPAGGSRWDAALSSFLAVRAAAADVKRDNYPQAATAIAAMNGALENLGDYLAKDCFPAANEGSRWPSQYETPTNFSPQTLAEKAKPVSAALQQLEASIAAP